MAFLITAIVFAVIIIFVVFTIFKGVRIVPQGSRWIVQRLGKYHKTLEPGLNFIYPYIDSVSENHKISTKEIVLDIAPQEVITKDNVTITANAVAYIRIIHPNKAIYAIEDYEVGIRNLVQTSLRSILGEMVFDDALSSREQIKTQLKDAISSDILDWGITLNTVEIQDISPSASMKKSMEEQAAAERERRAMVTRSEGQRESAILEAKGRLEASQLDAKAQVELARGSEESIRLIANAMGENEAPVIYLLGEQYIKSMQSMAKSDNAKTVVLPSDILNTIKGLTGDKLGKTL